jgi:aryl-phospho-beta-D-glucosidase BglC (GH1 family)
MNLGNWLVPEGYMFKFKTANSPRLIETVINQLVGEVEARRFWKTYRDNYITREDIHLLKKLGFNSVRIPSIIACSFRAMIRQSSRATATNFLIEL